MVVGEYVQCNEQYHHACMHGLLSRYNTAHGQQGIYTLDVTHHQKFRLTFWRCSLWTMCAPWWRTRR